VHISQVQEGGVGQVSDVLTVGQEVKVRVTNVDVAKRRIGLSMLEWREPSERPQRGGRGGGGGGGFGDDDKEFKMTVEELEALTVGDDFSSPFEAAFERAEFVQQAKSGKKKYAKQLL
jgi:predicted RNA-binding protein with RPS1 domain